MVIFGSNVLRGRAALIFELDFRNIAGAGRADPRLPVGTVYWRAVLWRARGRFFDWVRAEAFRSETRGYGLSRQCYSSWRLRAHGWAGSFRGGFGRTRADRSAG